MFPLQLHQDASEKTATFLKALEEKATAKVEGIRAAISDKLAKSKAKIHFALDETVGIVKATGELLKDITKTKIDKVSGNPIVALALMGLTSI